ncbi:O-antigen ligase family protein [Mesorhizobium sp. CAU 1741]|uniref:O-antigen ligase family protein n=1 Tax=Mesorhizobium sp. CAU 1741 TaxID=3140366 RepID=UPI00325C18C5
MGSMRHDFTRASPYVIPVNWQAVLAFCAFCAIVLERIFLSFSALLFLSFGAVLIISALRSKSRMLLRYWPLLLLPTYCIVSTLWSDYPAQTLRHSVQLALTLIIAMAVAIKLRSETIMRGLYCALAFAVVISTLVELTSGRATSWQGIYESKNVFASIVAIFLLMGISLLYFRENRLAISTLFTLQIIFCLYALIRSASAGMIISIIPVVALFFVFRFNKYLGDAQRAFLMIFIFLASITTAIFASLYVEEILAGVLEYFGKDPTLTGRTDLWNFAIQLIAERPVFGLGYKAFWVVGNLDAEALWAAFYLPSGSGFNFHNTYLSNTVEIGLVGITLQVFIFYIGLIRGIRLSLVEPTHDNIFWCAFMALTIIRSFGEVSTFFEFSLDSLVYYIAFITVSERHRERRRTMKINRTPFSVLQR